MTNDTAPTTPNLSISRTRTSSAPRARSSRLRRFEGTRRAYPRNRNEVASCPDRLVFVTFPRRAPGGFPVVGIIGGGQLARMCQPPAVGLSITLSVLAQSADDSAALVIPSSVVGEHTDVEAVRAFARECDVVTFDHEHVPAEVLSAREADGVVLPPSRAALVFAQDKLAMRRRLTDIGVACPAWAQVRDAAALQVFGDKVGWPVIVKTPKGGYDGK